MAHPNCAYCRGKGYHEATIKNLGTLEMEDHTVPCDHCEENPRIYRIIRFRHYGKAGESMSTTSRTVRSNVTLTEAQAHCRDPKTHGTRAGVRWFDGYDYMRGCAPRKGDL